MATVSLSSAGGSTGQAFGGWMVIRQELRRRCLMFVSMRGLFIFLVFQCIHEAWFQSCLSTGTDYVCKALPKDYPAGLTSVIIFVGGLGEINLSMFNSTNLASVNSLTMADQDITAIGPQTFDEFQNLKTLNLDNNHLSEVSSDWFSHQVTLEILRLTKNKITTLDHNSFDGMSNLLDLNLSQNQIHTITPNSFLGLGKLRELDLSNNALTHLSTDLFLPLNGTKIRLDGNPWDCSCSVYDFAKYLRGLQNASLLENELQVCCNSPPHLKAMPVWQVPECDTFTTMSPTTVSLTTGSPGTKNTATALISKPLTIGHSTLIILIVVLCALVLVICVLSALYHRKRERKHLHAVKPASEKSEMIRTSEATAKSNGQENRKVKSEMATKTQIATTEVLLRTNQMVAGDEKISQIYHIYSSGQYNTREAIKRVRSAGAVLCRMEMFSKPTEAEASTDEVGVRNDEYYNGWMTSEKQKDDVCVNIEEVEKLEDGENIGDEENDGFTDEVNNTTDNLESHEDLREKNEDADESASVDKDVLQHSVENDVLDHLPGAGSSQDVLHEKHITSQFEETAENLPYLTIGADPENQTSGVDQCTAKRTSDGPLRPIRRVLTWPPTAVQWKKQWAQNQQVLNVFPQLIFVTGCRHEIRPLLPGISPVIFPTAPQFNALEFLPEILSPMEDVRVAIDEDTYRASLESSNQRVLHFSAKECFANTDLSPREDGRIITNEEMWRSGLESTIFSDLSSKNSPVDENEACSELFSSFSFNPPFGGSKSKPAFGEEINKKDNVEKTQSVTTKTCQVHQSEQVASESQKQSRRAEKAAQRSHRDRRRRQGQGQMCDGSDPRAPPAGGSPKDDSLLLGNEYTFIDLLHEVVENHGRWTRDRWRQTQKNKHKLKQSR